MKDRGLMNKGPRGSEDPFSSCKLWKQNRTAHALYDPPSVCVYASNSRFLPRFCSRKNPMLKFEIYKLKRSENKV